MNQSSVSGKYSLKKFIDTHKKLLKLSLSLSEKSRSALKEKILFLTECLIWGDRNDDSIFEFPLFLFPRYLFPF